MPASLRTTQTLESTVVDARIRLSGARDAPTAHSLREPYSSMSEVERKLRNRLQPEAGNLVINAIQKGTQASNGWCGDGL